MIDTTGRRGVAPAALIDANVGDEHGFGMTRMAMMLITVVHVVRLMLMAILVMRMVSTMVMVNAVVRMLTAAVNMMLKTAVNIVTNLIPIRMRWSHRC